MRGMFSEVKRPDIILHHLMRFPSPTKGLEVVIRPKASDGCVAATWMYRLMLWHRVD